MRRSFCLYIIGVLLVQNTPLNFSHANPSSLIFEDTFSSPSLDSSWTWAPVDSTYSISGGSFNLQVAANEDTWVDDTNWGSPRLIQTAPTSDWTIETFLAFDPPMIDHQVGLIFYSGNNGWDNWYFFGYSWDQDTSHDLVFEGIDNNVGISPVIYSTPIESDWISGFYLRITFISTTNTYEMYYMKSGDSSYTSLTTKTKSWSNVQIGLFGKSYGSNPGFTASYDYVRIYNHNIFDEFNSKSVNVIKDITIVTISLFFLLKRKNRPNSV